MREVVRPLRLRIRHTTQFDYDEIAVSSFNQVRLTPRHSAVQNLLNFTLLTAPAAPLSTHYDHFGTMVYTFAVQPPHRQLMIVSESEVLTGVRAQPAPDTANIDALADADLIDLNAEWLMHSPKAHNGPELMQFVTGAEYSRESTSVVQLIERICDHVHGSLSYQPGTTYVHTTVAEVLQRRTGVCQDYVHVTVASLRSLGVPARYVSGYFYAGDPSVVSEEPVEVQSHAWVEAFVPGFGWWEFDPTNNCPADERHVVVAVGRDYGDVPPVSGVLQGGAGQRMSVRVEMVVDSTPPTMFQSSLGTQVGEPGRARLPASAVRRAAAMAQQQQ